VSVKVFCQKKTKKKDGWPTLKDGETLWELDLAGTGASPGWKKEAGGGSECIDRTGGSKTTAIFFWGVCCGGGGEQGERRWSVF